VPIGGNENGIEPISQRQRTAVSRRDSAVDSFEVPNFTPKLRIHVITFDDAQGYQVGNS
jgi:hypothetical protein